MNRLQGWRPALMVVCAAAALTATSVLTAGATATGASPTRQDDVGAPRALWMNTKHATPDCSTSNLVTRGGRESDGAFYAVAGYVEFRNIGPNACRLDGRPRVALIADDGTRLPLRFRISRRATLEARVLPPGARWSAELEVVWENWCGSTPGPLDVRVRIGRAGSTVGQFNGPPGYALVPGCLDSDRPSTLELMDAYSRA